MLLEFPLTFQTHILHQHRYGSFLAPLGEHVNNTVQIIDMGEGKQITKKLSSVQPYSKFFVWG